LSLIRLDSTRLVYLIAFSLFKLLDVSSNYLFFKLAVGTHPRITVLAPPLTCKEEIASQFDFAIITTQKEVYIALNVPKLCTVNLNLLRSKSNIRWLLNPSNIIRLIRILGWSSIFSFKTSFSLLYYIFYFATFTNWELICSASQPGYKRHEALLVEKEAKKNVFLFLGKKKISDYWY
jgi:hypothetical protein